MAETSAKRQARSGRPLRRVPQRTCVACGESKAKRELVRVVHTPSGHVEVDLTGKKAGRGAYLCTKKACWDLGLKKRALDRALKTTIGAEDTAQLQAHAETLQQ
jgi:uncharacterized protein